MMSFIAGLLITWNKVSFVWADSGDGLFEPFQMNELQAVLEPNRPLIILVIGIIILLTLVTLKIAKKRK